MEKIIQGRGCYDGARSILSNARTYGGRYASPHPRAPPYLHYEGLLIQYTYVRGGRPEQGELAAQCPLLLYIRVEGVKRSDHQTLGNQIM